MIIVEPDDAGFREAVAALRRDEVVAYPTETVYGLAVNPFSIEALQRLWDVKGRDSGNPVLVIVRDALQLAMVTSSISPAAQRCIEVFWPGPLTLVLPKHDSIPHALTAGRDKVAVRQPSNSIALRLCRAAGMPLTSTSANVSGEPPASQLSAIGLAGVAVGIEGGVLPASVPSTIYDPDEDVVFREGLVSGERLRAAVRGGVGS